MIDEQEKDGFLSWVKLALDKGAGIAHRWTSQRSKAPPPPHFVEDGDQVLYDPVQKGEYYARMWDKLWGQYVDEHWETMQDIKNTTAQ